MHIKRKFESPGISAYLLYCDLTPESPASEQTEKSKESIVKAYLKRSEERYGMQCEQLLRQGEEWRWELEKGGESGNLTHVVKVQEENRERWEGAALK